MRPELLEILGAGPGAETANEVRSQILKFRALNLEGNACSQMLDTAYGREETCSRFQRFGHTFANRSKPLAGEVVEDGDMGLQKIAGGRKVFLPETIEGLDIIRLDMRGYDQWR